MIAPFVAFTHINCQIIVEGIFNDGYLEGPVRGLDPYGNLVFVGFYRKGLPFGECWLAKEGQGWLYGQVDDKGRFTGTHIAYVYPNLCTAICGTFREEILVEARATVIVKVS